MSTVLPARRMALGNPTGGARLSTLSSIAAHETGVGLAASRHRHVRAWCRATQVAECSERSCERLGGEEGKAPEPPAQGGRLSEHHEHKRSCRKAICRAHACWAQWCSSCACRARWPRERQSFFMLLCMCMRHCWIVSCLKQAAKGACSTQQLQGPCLAQGGQPLGAQASTAMSAKAEARQIPRKKESRFRRGRG
jgi:hypothetical protein